jgi:hypothetical protein
MRVPPPDRESFLIEENEEILTGGNMSSPIRTGNHIFKEATKATESIHQLLCHVKKKGLDWVPQSFGIDSKGRHELEFIEGVVPHDTPDWLWDRIILGEAAARIREWHNATPDFDLARTQWLMENHEPKEVICHNDFAPYNCVFRDNSLVGLIDFDVCSPGSRLWDLAYAAYRFVPLWPDRVLEPQWDISPFTIQEMQERLQFFLETYSREEKEFHYSPKELILKVQERLKTLSLWSKNFGEQKGNAEILDNARMYATHGDWVLNLI